MTRKKILPEIPKNFDEIFLPEEWTKTEGNQRFLLLQESGIFLPIKDSNFYQDQNVYLRMERSKPLQNHLCKFIHFLEPLKIGKFRLPGRSSETRPKDHTIGLSVIWMKKFSKNLVSNSYQNFF